MPNPEYNKAYYQKNKETLLRKTKEYRIKNADRIKEDQARYYNNYYKNPSNKAKIRAKQHIKNLLKKYPNSVTYDGSEEPELLELWCIHTMDRPCKYCGNPSNNIDHIHPLSKGGLHKWENIQMVCQECNRAKNDKMENDFIKWLDSLTAWRSAFKEQALTAAELSLKARTGSGI